MISIHLSDLTTDIVIWSLCFWLAMQGLCAVIRVWLFFKEKQAIDASRKTGIKG